MQGLYPENNEPLPPPDSEGPSIKGNINEDIFFEERSVSPLVDQPEGIVKTKEEGLFHTPYPPLTNFFMSYYNVSIKLVHILYSISSPSTQYLQHHNFRHGHTQALT